MGLPKRKRLKRKQRLEDAENWVYCFNGKNIVKSYKKWYGVDIMCALNELEMLGYYFPDYKQKIINQRKIEKQKKEEKEKIEAQLDPWQDGSFFFIAGYTSGGVPFGITWEEHNNQTEIEDEIQFFQENNNKEYSESEDESKYQEIDEDGIPF
ncbi:hypothetical protein [Natranaerobius trueperi]|uniref:Uncharacterized protein n=1 Tax=Natranaerobius trueperi TaxID=759412 RepID=A0A226BX47_9FIRM|nr:hypothetical protein [Natranaerobius trueperi]OWZ82769.1 hypothetical protein CDO51_12360 [Natranaerobius trueperi]